MVALARTPRQRGFLYRAARGRGGRAGIGLPLGGGAAALLRLPRNGGRGNLALGGRGRVFGIGRGRAGLKNGKKIPSI